MIPYRIVPLKEFLEVLSETQITKLLGEFLCSRDYEREDFLHNRAIMYEKKGLSRTYLALSEEGYVIGYFTLGIKCMRVPDDAPTSVNTRKKMNIDPTSNVAQSYLLGQLGRSDDSPKGFGEELLVNALNIIRNANELVGCRVLRVDCSDNLIEYYTDHEFKFITRSEWDGYTPVINQMVMII